MFLGFDAGKYFFSWFIVIVVCVKLGIRQHSLCQAICCVPQRHHHWTAMLRKRMLPVSWAPMPCCLILSLLWLPCPAQRSTDSCPNHCLPKGGSDCKKRILESSHYGFCLPETRVMVHNITKTSYNFWQWSPISLNISSVIGNYHNPTCFYIKVSSTRKTQLEFKLFQGMWRRLIPQKKW